MTRIFQATDLQTGAALRLSQAASHYLINVLRVRLGESLTLFNGQGGEYTATISQIQRKEVAVLLGEHLKREAESPLQLHLGQGISRGEKMDYTLQKAVELGVHAITPLLTTRCNVRLNQERLQKKLAHWQAIVIHACEQCGRNFIPTVFPPKLLSDWLEEITFDHAFVLTPTDSYRLHALENNSPKTIALLVGSEGGLEEAEVNLARAKQFSPLSLGPRILRTETAGIAAISILQNHFGDG